MFQNLILVLPPSNYTIKFLKNYGRITSYNVCYTKLLREAPFTAVGLVQGKVLDMIAAADVAEKAANVRVFVV